MFMNPMAENKGIEKIVWDFIGHEFSHTEIWKIKTPIHKWESGSLFYATFLT